MVGPMVALPPKWKRGGSSWYRGLGGACGQKPTSPGHSSQLEHCERCAWEASIGIGLLRQGPEEVVAVMKPRHHQVFEGKKAFLCAMQADPALTTMALSHKEFDTLMEWLTTAVWEVL